MKNLNLSFDPFFMWSNRPKILYAPGVREELGYEMAGLGGKRPLVITDQGVVAAGAAQLILDAIEDSDLELAGVFDTVIQDARMDIINQGAAFYRACRADSMVVVGGGSVMDTAQAINIMIGEGAEDFQPLAEQVSLFENPKPLPPQIVFPTTAGTGSEVTIGLVVLDTTARLKMGVAHPFNADIAMLDPELTLTLPPKITASTGMDALTHAIEGIVSTGAQPISDALGLHAIRLISTQLPLCIQEPQNLDARGQMLIASTMAGMCFNNTMTGAVHALAHALGGEYQIPHGIANAMLLPLVMAFNLQAAPLRYAMIAAALGVNTHAMTPSDAAMAAVSAVNRLKQEIGLTERLADFGVPQDPELLTALIDKAASDSQLSYNPQEMEEQDILDIYLKAM